MTLLKVSVRSLPGGRHIDLIQSKKGRRHIVCYHESAEALAAKCGGVDGIVIPFQQGGADYDPAFLLEHIRLSDSPILRKLPVWVYCADAEQRKLAVTMQGLGVGGASLVGPGKVTSADLLLIPDIAVSDAYVGSVANRPRFDSGRHDCANAWGAYAILRASSALAGSSEAVLGEIESRLLEDTYYKKKIQFLEKWPADEGSFSETRRQLARFQVASAKLGKLNVLIAEDQWEAGWGAAYEAVFSSAGVPIQIAHAESIEKFLALFRPDLHDIVVLDMRLREEGTAGGTHDAGLQLSGVRLAKEIRIEEDRLSIGRTLPVLAATASNKASTLDALLHCGINGYWVKESPDESDAISDCLGNLGDLYSRLADILTWSALTRPWIQKTYGFALAVKKMGGSLETVEHVRAKALSLNALLFQAFSPFSREMDSGLQLNICYLTIYSLLNELLSTLLVERKSDQDSVWLFPCKMGAERIVTHDKMNSNTPWLLADDIVSGLAILPGKDSSRNFPDSRIFQYLAHRYGGIGISHASELVNLRNALPLVHGLQPGKGPKLRNAVPEDIDTLLAVFSQIIGCRDICPAS